MQYANEIGSSCNFQVSQGSVLTFKVSWRILMYVYNISSGFWQWTNFGSWYMFAKVIVKSWVYFWKHFM